MMIEVTSEDAMKAFGVRLGGLLTGSESIELVGDVGAGKTTLTKGIGQGMGVTEVVQSPSFTINRVYDTPNKLKLAHYDFYRLSDAGIMANELQEAASDQKTVTIIEWAGVVNDVLPDDRLMVAISSPTETTRHIDITAGGPTSQALLEQLA